MDPLFIFFQSIYYIAKRKKRDRVIEIETQSGRPTHKKIKKTFNELIKRLLERRRRKNDIQLEWKTD